MPGIPRPQNLDKIPRNYRNQSVNPLYLTCCHIVYLNVFLIQFRFQLVLCYRNTTFVITIPKSKTNERHPIPRTFVHTQLADRANTLTLGRDSEWPFRLKTRHFQGRHIQPAWICHQGVHSQAPELLEKEMVSREMCQMRWISFRPKSQRHPQSQSAWQEIWPNIRGQKSNLMSNAQSSPTICSLRLRNASQTRKGWLSHFTEDKATASAYAIRTDCSSSIIPLSGQNTSWTYVARGTPKKKSTVSFPKTSTKSSFANATVAKPEWFSSSNANPEKFHFPSTVSLYETYGKSPTR